MLVSNSVKYAACTTVALVLTALCMAARCDERASAESKSAASVTRGDSNFSDAERSFWSFRSPVDPPLPAVKRADWPQSPLDHFILAGLESNGLEPAPPADKRALIRRATFDLLGLPPTPAEMNAFLADDSPHAFARVVDRLLASPHYGERWGRHWLDVARYADSNGMDENLAQANAWRYRDYIIDAFNRDTPYDQFVREQLAGDLLNQESGIRNQESGGRASDSSLPPDSWLLTPSSGRLVATGFLSLGPKMLAEDDPVKMEMDIIDEQVDTIGRTFLGLTLGCARCHDHKFDPIRMNDYYALAGIFKSTKTMDHFKVVARWHERPLGTAEQIADQEARQQSIAAKKTEINRLTSEANDSLLGEARRRAGDYLLAASEIERQRKLQGELKSLVADAPQTVPGSIVIEAEDFTRGNVKKEFSGYGEKIGVIYNQGELPNFAEFDVEVAAAGAFQLELRYAAAESRPVRLAVNGKTIRADAAGKTTGSWFPDTQAWHPEAIVALGAGNSTIRLEREQPFPHFDKLALVPRDSAAAPIGVPKTAEEIAAERGLNSAIIQQWQQFLNQSRNDENSVLHAWHAVTALEPTSGSAALFADLRAAAERALAARFQELCDQADRAWRDLKAKPEGKDAKNLPDPALEPLRKLLYDPKGPFALPSKPESYYAAATSAEFARLRDELAALEKSFTPLPEAMAAAEGSPQNLRVHLRGSHLTLGDEVPRRFPSVLAGEDQPAVGDKESGRRQLADWLARPDHPLTSRVMVNRIWRWHFGEGIVRSTDNFGKLGERPTNPQLLDWLACRFVANGWSIKSMHRLMLLSATYQMSTRYDARAASADPENRLLWRMNRRRLDAEEVRDAILAVSGQLDLAMGNSLLDSGNRAYVKGYPNSVYDKYEFRRRSVYLPVLRSMLYDVFQAFDFCDPSTANGERATTTVAPQALFMLNSKLVADETRHLANDVLANSGVDDLGRVRVLYERVLGRPASDAETARSVDFVRRYESALDGEKLTAGDRRGRAWQALCRTIVASNEFIYVE